MTSTSPDKKRKLLIKEIKSMLKDNNDIVLLNYIYVLLLKSLKEE